MRSLILTLKELIQITILSLFKIVLYPIANVQNFLQEELKSRFFANMEGQPSSPDCNPLDCYFRNKVKEKIYSGHHTMLNVSRLKKVLKYRIFSMWDQCANNIEPLCKLIKQFLPRLKAVVTKEGRPIKTVFD